MSYKPQQGLFVNGRIADANEVLNEFNAISVSIAETENAIAAKTAEAQKASQDYTDKQLADTTVDGGTF